MKSSIYFLLTLSFSCFSIFAFAQHHSSAAPSEGDFYKMVTLPIPEGIVLEVGGMVSLPNGSLATATRRGEVWIIENPYLKDGQYPHFRRFARGMHEILGLAYKDNHLYATQRGELTRLVDKNEDGRAEKYETFCAWPISGNYHEYSYGPAIGPDGSFYVTGNVGFGGNEWWRGKSWVPWRGWAMRITPDGELQPFAAGMRSPCGLGIIDGELFYADNQGDWMGSGGLVHVEKGDFMGHPASLNWSDHPDSPVKISKKDIYYRVNPRLARPGEQPIKPENIENEIPQPLFSVEKDLTGIKTPSVWLPHAILGISNSEIITDQTKGDFGPFDGQVFIGDQGQSKIMRVFLEKVKGVYQGAAFNFREGFQSGVLRMCWGKDGSLFVGQTNRGWGSTGKDAFGLQRLVWSGRTPFEMKAVRAMPDGFEIEFTQPVDKASASDPASYEITGFIYKYHPVYGSPIANDENCPIKGIVLSDDGMKARLVVDNLRLKYIHEIKATGVRAYQGHHPLLHNAAYYTLNAIPEGEKLKLPEPIVETTKPLSDKKVEPNPLEAPKKSALKPRVKKEKPAKASKKAIIPKSGKLLKRQTKMPSNWGKPDQSIIISTIPGLKYDQKSLTVKAGSKVKLTFYNNDDMPHNIVFVQAGQADTVGKMAIDLGLKGPGLNYIPKSSKIMYHTNLLAPATSESIYFIAPNKAGSYTYVCTVPGHASVMRGTLIVR